MTPPMIFNKASAAPCQAGWQGAFWTMLSVGRDGADELEPCSAIPKLKSKAPVPQD